MKYDNITIAKFIERPNRFIAYVDIDGKREKVHVKNTGRCKELLLPSVQVGLEKSDNPARSTQYDLVTVYKEGIGWINMDSQAPNKVVHEWLQKQKDISYIKPEYTYGDSRIDFYFEKEDGTKVLMEVKGVTLERGRIAYFPDAPTQRGVKHINELVKAMEQGYRVYLAFVIQMNEIYEVRPNDETHPEFGQALRRAEEAGVTILELPCRVTESELEIYDN